MSRRSEKKSKEIVEEKKVEYSLEDRELAKKIQTAFENKLQKNVGLNYIMQALSRKEKKGITNYFVTIKLKSDATYVIRINGNLWPPYKRQDEARALHVLESNGINTGVLYNDDSFQICEHFDKSLSFSNILEKKDLQEVMLAARLVAKVMVRYHKILVKNHILYPITQMIQDAMNGEYGIKAKFKGNEGSYPLELDDLFATCQKILIVLNHSRIAHQFSHSDLFTDSIFVDLANQKVTIVDWEYSANAYWSNDLAKLCSPLSSEVSALLSKYYYCEMSGANNVQMPESMRQEIQLNSFLHQFLKIAWTIKPSNVATFKDVIFSMSLEKAVFSGELDELHKTATSNSVMSFVRQHPYWAGAGLFAVTAVGTALYARYSDTPGEVLEGVKKMMFSSES